MNLAYRMRLCVVSLDASKYLCRLNRTDRISFIYSGGVRLEYSYSLLHLISHISLNIHDIQHLHVRRVYE